MATKKLLLSEFLPHSELMVDVHEITQPRYPVIDFHTHFGTTFAGDSFEAAYDTGAEVAKLQQMGVSRVVNLDGMNGELQARMRNKTADFSDFFITFGWVNVSSSESPLFAERVRSEIVAMHQHGIKGLKFFKEFGLHTRDRVGKRIAIDDARYKVIWDTAAELDLPILIHVADPPAFFKPIDRFNERYEELQRYPEWSFYNSGTFGFEQMMEMQQRLLQDNPNTTFVVAHAGSWGENLKWVGKCLDRYPNMYIDIAARISELGRQPNAAKKFFVKYQDRILFGTDGGPGNTGYKYYYRFLESDDDYFDYSAGPVPPQGRWKIYGIGLEDAILKKVYSSNAKKILKIV